MTERFIKLIDSPLVLDLIIKSKNAHALLTIIAMRARRISGGLDGLEIGEAILGDYQSFGFTRKEYRYALEILVKHKFIEISLTNRTCKNGATSRATKSTIVKLLDSSIWDINSENQGHLKGHLGATSGPPRGHKQERIRKNKKEKEIEQNIRANADASGAISSSPDSKILLTEFDNPFDDEMQHNLYYPPTLVTDSLLTNTNSNKDSNNSQLTNTIEYYQTSYDNLKITLSEHKEFVSKHGEELIKASYAYLAGWKQGKTAKELGKHSDAGRLTRWAITATRKRIIEEKELQLREERLQQKKDTPAYVDYREKNRQYVLQKFKGRETYNDAIISIGQDGIGFDRGMNHQEVKFSERGFEELLKHAMRKYD